MSAEPKESSLNSEEFIKKVRSRDSKAIETLVRAYTEHLYRAALGLGFEGDSARELVQRVWTTFYDIASDFEGRSQVRTFLFGILYNKASELRRENARFDLTDPVEEILEARFDSDGQWVRPPIDPERFLQATETLGLIQKCMENLPLAQRMAFSLKEVDGHGSSDVCKILDVTVTHLGVLLFRARNRLRECIESKAKVKE